MTRSFFTGFERKAFGTWIAAQERDLPSLPAQIRKRAGNHMKKNSKKTHFHFFAAVGCALTYAPFAHAATQTPLDCPGVIAVKGGLPAHSRMKLRYRLRAG
jgi:hypothetical protein